MSIKLENLESYPHLDRVPASEGDWFQALIALARYLRTPEGCPWDREQRALEFAKYAKGEAEEFVEALEGDDGAHMAEEFGDAFFTLLASAAAAEEEGLFNLEDALELAHAKMVRRHEHVFGDEKAATAEDAVRAWDRAKEKERR